MIAGSADAVMMVEAGASEATEEQMVRARRRVLPSSRSSPAIDMISPRPPARRRSSCRPRSRTTTSTARSRKKVYVPLSEAERIKEKLESYGRVDQVLADLVASVPRAKSRAAARGQTGFKGLEGEGAARRYTAARSPPLWPEFSTRFALFWSEVTVLPLASTAQWCSPAARRRPWSRRRSARPTISARRSRR